MLSQLSQTVMQRILEQVPVKALVVVPLRPLPEFATHKEQFLAGVSVHPGVEHSEIRKLLPGVSRHLVDKRSLAMNDFVMAQHQNEMLVEGVDQRKGRIALMKSAMDRLAAHVHQVVVHPTHVPLESKPKSAEIGGSGDAGPGSGLFRDRHDTWVALITDLVEAFHEINRIKIFAPAVYIRDPLPCLTRVIEVKH